MCVYAADRLRISLPWLGTYNTVHELMISRHLMNLKLNHRSMVFACPMEAQIELDTTIFLRGPDSTGGCARRSPNV